MSLCFCKFVIVLLLSICQFMFIVAFGKKCFPFITYACILFHAFSLPPCCFGAENLLTNWLDLVITLVLIWFCLVPNEKALVLHWFCLVSNEKALDLHWFCLGSNENAMVLQWFCLGPNEKALVVQWFCLGSNDK